MEKFKQIKNYENYSVSNYGKIRNDKTGRILKPQKNTCGYLFVVLYENGVCKTLKIHRLVALAFIDNPENKRTINHIDGVKINNFVDNLEWNTQSENMQHAVNTGLNDAKGIKNGRAKLSENQVLEIRKLYATGDYYQKDLAKIFDVHQTVIGFIINRKLWKHI